MAVDLHRRIGDRMSGQTSGLLRILRGSRTMYAIDRSGADSGLLRKFGLSAAGCALIGLISFMDWRSAQLLSLYVFYSVPVFIAAWYLGAFQGVFFCVLSVLAWMAVDLRLRPWPYSLILWNALLRLCFFIAISTVISSLRSTLSKLKSVAGRDFLTELPNRRTLFTLAEQERQRAIRYNHPLTLAYIDLDNFKEVNDRSGHDFGDLLLKDVASQIRNQIRSSDIAARIGGDEFVVLFPESDFDSAEIALTKLHRSLEERIQIKNRNVTVSIGAVTYTAHFPELKEMIKAADLLMYSSKAEGKSMVRHAIGDVAKLPRPI